MAKKRAPFRRRTFIPTNLSCYFCDEKKVPSYKDYQILGKFLSDRAKIIGKKMSGVCSRHQKILTVELKRARYLGLLPFSPRI
ncbi:30S ribosomal protein S18 [Candidatus Woesebacteria bacterium RBG_16_34_12]|uniref:Small ribosomal subunit protein bS18 n=1 Tax=Candidatus Woesebacteria bacterium RBG_16_34_12 TaxID=1802480 RepID=A0A1F7X983_9BACT|nr:MAG: 30S ribosomal protein S18 [Candidatus Woesebacteria bacterium RBG_16_34_12]